MLELLQQTQEAAVKLRQCTAEQRRTLVMAIADELVKSVEEIMAANQQDLAEVPDSDPKKDRLRLTSERIQGIAHSIRVVAELPAPDGQVLSEKILPNGMLLKKIAVPLGVVGAIYESRPNVTLDISSIGLRSGNAVALRGGSEAWHTNSAIVAMIHRVLQRFQLPEAVVTLLPTDRALLPDLFKATRYVDVLIPRGSQSLIQLVREQSLIPTIETGAGVCHTYVHAAADLSKAQRIVVNAKVSRPSVCNALDTILVDRAVAEQFLPTLVPDFEQYQVEVLAYESAYQIFQKTALSRLQAAEEADFGREFLDFKCSVKVVEGLAEALAHIRTYSSRHSEAIVSEDESVCQVFIEQVDAAAVYANASTRFTDGGEFGLGAEIGISTQKLHARGPFALEKLVTEKWIGIGNGHIRV
jgi:glutamate-5-semialdehyde dehydrogenase